MNWTELPEAEWRVRAAALAGKVADFGDADPIDGETWGAERTLGAEFLRSLCCDTSSAGHPKGCRIRGARIHGVLDFEHAELRAPLHLVACFVQAPINLRWAKVRDLVLSGSRTVGFDGHGLDCAASILLDSGFSADGTVRLSGARIGGDLECGRGRFENPGGEAISAENLTCGGDVFLTRRFSARGEVRFVGAEIRGDLDCSGGVFENPDGDALVLDSVKCGGSVYLRRDEEEKADFSARGPVRLVGATIAGDLDCDGGRFENRGADALDAERFHCKGSVFLRSGFEAKGRVRLLEARIDGNLECDGGRFLKPGGGAIVADSLQCGGSVWLQNGCVASGEVRFPSAAIGGDLILCGGRFANPDKQALHLAHATVGRELCLRGLAAPPDGRVDLTAARVGTYTDDRASWPGAEALDLIGFRYTSIEPDDLDTRLDWLCRARFAPQPYEQLAGVLRQQGHSESATSVLVAKERARIERGGESRWVKLRLHFLGLTIGYGYRPGKAVWGLLACWLIGWGLFTWAWEERIFAPTNVSITTTEEWRAQRELPAAFADYSPFSAWLYSLDTLLPVVDLHMESAWEPTLAVPGDRILGTSLAWLVWFYLRLHIAVGWILTTLAVLGFTGVVRPR